MTSPIPRLTIGLPVYNGEPFLTQALDALLGQTYTDFELVISDNASTDASVEICQDYARRDARIRVIRQPHNIGAVPNHFATLDRARGELFTWASADDLYGAEFLERCIALLDQSPDAILAHSWTAAIDAGGTVIHALKYPLHTAAEEPAERVRSLLFDHDRIQGAIAADDFYGVFRTEALRQAPVHGAYYHADQTYMIGLALRGRFVHHPEWLYFRRHHPGRAALAHTTVAGWTANLDPARRDASPARLVAEFAWAQFAVIQNAPISAQQKWRCYRHLARWATSRVERRLGAGSRFAQAVPDTAGLAIGDLGVVVGR